MSEIFDLKKAQDNNNNFLAITIDMHKTLDYCLKYIKTNEAVNKTQHAEIEKLVMGTYYNKEQ